MRPIHWQILILVTKNYVMAVNLENMLQLHSHKQGCHLMAEKCYYKFTTASEEYILAVSCLKPQLWIENYF